MKKLNTRQRVFQVLFVSILSVPGAWAQTVNEKPALTQALTAESMVIKETPSEAPIAIEEPEMDIFTLKDLRDANQNFSLNELKKLKGNMIKLGTFTGSEAKEIDSLILQMGKPNNSN